MTRSHEYRVTLLVDGDEQVLVTVAVSEDAAVTQAVQLVRRMMPLVVEVTALGAHRSQYRPVV